jgi:hypothetical protein
MLVPLNGTTTAVGGYVGVKELQKQLQRIASEFQKQDVAPGTYDGTMTLGTIIALANAVPIVGDKLHAGIGQAFDVVKLIKAPVEKLPYGSTIINFVLSPWIIDKIYEALLGIIRIAPGGGKVAGAIDKGVETAKAAIANVAGGIATALRAVKKTSSGLGQTQPGYCWIPATATMPGHWVPQRAGQPCPTQTTAAPPRECSAANPSGCPGGVYVPSGSRVLPPPSSPLPGSIVVRDRRPWPVGKEIVPSEWSRTHTYDGIVPFSNLAKSDQDAWKAKQKFGPFANIQIPSSFNFGVSASTLARLTVGHGAIAFKTFQGADGTRMGAFWDVTTQRLKIIPVPKPSSSKYPWDFMSDAVKATADAVGEAAGAIGDAISDIAQDTWNWIKENADDVYRAVKKYGCALVNNDIVVAAAAAGASIVATPAAGAAITGGAAIGKTACAALDVAELLYAIYKFLTTKVPPPPPLTPEPPEPSTAPPSTAPPPKLALPATPPVVPLAKPRYPSGSIAAYDPKLHAYRVAIPAGSSLSDALGAAAPFVEVDVVASAPETATVMPLSVYQRQTGTLPLYKNTAFWIAVGVGALAVAGTSYTVYRRRRDAV